MVDNRPGGSGILAMGMLAKAAPDGHTLATIGLPQIVAPSLMAELPYDTLRDFAPVIQLAWSANVLVVGTASSLRGLSDFVTLAKAKPGALTYASGGNGTPSHLASELLKRHAGIDVRHVPYKGIPAGLAAVMGDQVDIAFAGIATALPLVRSGRLRALATAGAQRLPALADVPTIAEVGFPGFQQNEWYGVVAPAGTPPEVIARLAADLARIVTRADVHARLTHVGLYPVEKSGPEALGALIRTELPRWRAIVREAGIKAE
jgi:tripartite-type tricarboxylate transporter receptor subunit TctC